MLTHGAIACATLSSRKSHINVRHILRTHLAEHDHYHTFNQGSWLIRYNVSLMTARLSKDEVYALVRESNPGVLPLEAIEWDGNARLEQALHEAVTTLFYTNVYKTPSPEAARQYSVTQKPLDLKFALMGRGGAKLVVTHFKGHKLDASFDNVFGQPNQFDALSCRQMLAMLQTWEIQFNELRVCRLIESLMQEKMLEQLSAAYAKNVAPT